MELSAADYTVDEIRSYLADIKILSKIITDQRHVMVYKNGESGRYGYIKHSNETQSGDHVYQYNDLYHARVRNGDHDPLLVAKLVVLDKIEHPALVFGFLTNHPSMFGQNWEKPVRKRMNEIRGEISDRADSIDI